MTAEQSLVKLVKRLDRIAEHNDDEFKYVVDVTLRRDGTPVFQVEALETADRHTLVVGLADNISSACDDAEAGIADMLEAWGYDEP